MRRFISGLLLAGLFLFCNSTQAMAQKELAGRELNQRIQALRDRLQNFQSRRDAKTPENQQIDSSDLILDQFEQKKEKIVEELESRKDVAVTVLFHDPETANGLVGDNLFATSEDSIASECLPQPATVLTVSIPKPALVAGKNTSDKADSRLNRYEELRQRVYLATRNARSQAMDINRQIARIQ